MKRFCGEQLQTTIGGIIHEVSSRTGYTVTHGRVEALLEEMCHGVILSELLDRVSREVPATPAATPLRVVRGGRG